MRSLKHLVIRRATLLCNCDVIAHQIGLKPLSGKLTAGVARGNICSHDQTVNRRATSRSRDRGARAAVRVRALAGRARCPLRDAPHLRRGHRARPAEPDVREPRAARARARRPSVGASAARGSACCRRRLISRLPIGCRPKGVIRQGFPTRGATVSSTRRPWRRRARPSGETRHIPGRARRSQRDASHVSRRYRARQPQPELHEHPEDRGCAARADLRAADSGRGARIGRKRHGSRTELTHAACHAFASPA